MFQLLVLLPFRNKGTDEMVHVGKDVQRGDSRSLIISNRSEEEGASLIVQLLKKTRLQCRRLWFNSWVGKTHWRKDRLPTPVFLGFPCRSSGKESSCNAGGPRLTPGLGRSPGEGEKLPTPVFHGLENSMGCMDHGVTESDMTE